MEEFGITFEDVLPYAFKHCNSNFINSFDETKKLCWHFLPNESSCVSELDDWGYHGSHVRYNDVKRERFISNCEKIEMDFATLVEEISNVYSDSFYLIGVNANNEVKVSAVDEVMTCLHYWK